MGARATIALAAVLVVAGGAFASPSLYVPGVALGLLAGGAVGWALIAAQGARIERAPGPATVAEGDPYPVRISVRAGLLPPRGEIDDPLISATVRVPGRGRGGVRVPRPRARASIEESVAFERRGRRQVRPPRLVVRDPLGIFSRTVEGSEPSEVLVLPRIEPVVAAGGREGTGGALSGAGDGIGGGFGATLDVELDGLRPYRKGSPASRIHWPAVARHQELIERRLASGGDGTALVVLDAERPAGDDELDRAVRAAASLAVRLARGGGCTLLISGTSRPLRLDPQLRGWAQAHARLALVEPGGAVAGVAQAASGGTTFWVTAAEHGGPRRMRGSPTTVLVTPFPPVGGRAEFTVAGCHGRLLAGRRGAAATTRGAA